MGAGLAASLARPGGNFTGTTQQAPELAPKRLQLLVETLPRVSRVDVIWNAANPAFARPWKEIQDAGRTLGIHIESREVRGPSDLERVFATMAASRPDALLFVGDQLTLQHGQQIVNFVTQKRIPSMFDRPHLVAAGGLMSYGADEEDSYRQAAIIADKIFRGAKPAEIPPGTADEVPICHQPQDCQGSRPDVAADAAAASRSGHRIACARPARPTPASSTRLRRVLFALVSAASFRNRSVGVPDPASNLPCPL
jgi:ABC-type uncharacterized transport system substrate-binding protein